MQVTLVIPAYNEEKRLDPFLRSISAHLAQDASPISDVIVVDDGSTDETCAVVERWRQIIPVLRIVKHEVNLGKGAAVRTGVLAVEGDEGDCVIFMDADGSTGIAELPMMMEALRSADVAVGNRWMRGANSRQQSMLRRVASWTYRCCMSLCGLGNVDTMCGFKGFRRDAARVLFADLREPRWLFDIEVAYKATLRGYRICNFPIHWESKDGSKLSAATFIKAAFNIWPLLWRLHRQPLSRR
jgi:dolichyl-phosphate beta-glucosyltransferase